jgi:hypothetical protein
MFEEHGADVINRLCREEAMSVQDLLTPAPPRRTWHTAARAHLVTVVTGLQAWTRRWTGAWLGLRCPGPGHPCL